MIMKSDAANIQNLFKIGKVLGVSPKWGENISSWFRLYVFILIFLAILGTVLSLVRRYAALWDLHMNTVQVFLEGTECLSALCFLLACFVGVFKYANNWRIFFYNISKTEELLHKLGITIEYNKRCYLLQIFMFHVVFLIMHVYEILLWIKLESLTVEYGYILYRIIVYYQFFTIYTIVCITQMLKKRYAFLNAFIQDVLKKRKEVTIISAKNGQDISRKLYKVQKVYTMLYLVLEQFNVIFGWRIFFNFSTYVLIILGNINYLLKYSQTEDAAFNARIFFNYIMHSAIYTVSTVAMVVSCDGVEKEGKKIVETCFLHQDVLEKAYFKDELVILAKIMNKLAPTISSAGFFQINQSVLSTLFSAVMTYLIILIQFH